MVNALDNAGIFLTHILFGMYIMLLLLRVLLQWHRANYQNPVCQLIGKLTNPVIIPLRKIIPRFKRLDTAALVLAYVLNYLKLLITNYLHAGVLFILPLIPLAFVDLAVQFCKLLVYAILFMIILSWLSPGVYNPISEVLYLITEPLLRPVRRLIPPIAGFDISPIPVMIGLGLVIVILTSLLP